MRYPGGIMRASPVVPTITAASGVWRLEEAYQYRAQGIWPVTERVLTYIGQELDEADLTTYTFTDFAATSVSAGHIIFGVSAGSLTRALSSGTVNGNAASLVNSVQGGNGTVGLLICAHPGGAIGNITATFAAGEQRCFCAIWHVINLASITPTDFGSGTGVDPSDTITTTAGGIAVGLWGSTAATAGIAWTGLTEIFDANPSAAWSAASASDLAGGSLAITADGPTGANQGMTCAAWF